MKIHREAQGDTNSCTNVYSSIIEILLKKKRESKHKAGILKNTARNNERHNHTQITEMHIRAERLTIKHTESLPIVAERDSAYSQRRTKTAREWNMVIQCGTAMKEKTECDAG